jgi:4-hydroxy-2-oxoheptanedioate aldolase
MTHPLLQVLRSRKPAFGAWLTVPGLFHARSLAKSSPHLSWIVVDCEHGLVPLVPGAAESVAAVEGAGVSSIVRIPATGVTGSTSWQIKNALDAGARGVLVPMVRKLWLHF